MTNEKIAIKRKRIYFLDNLRTFMIFLVVLVHTCGVYESSGTWAFFWIVDDPSTNWLSDKIFLIIDIFVMSTIFFISGYLTPLSLKSKNSRVFIKTKFKRLIIPWIIAVFTLIPVYKIIFLYSRNLPQESWTSYFHFSNGIFGQNWLWFLPVLFLFDLIFLGFSKLNLTLPKIGLKAGVGVVFVLGLIYSISMDILKLQGWTKTILIDFQNERLLIYFLIFLLGGLCYKLKIFDSKPGSKKLYIAVLCFFWIPIYIYQYFYVQSFVFPGVYIFSETADKVLMWLTFHLSLLCLIYLMVNTFWFFPDRQGKFGKILSENSYNVYIIHTVVLGGIVLTMLNTETPSLLKLFTATLSTYIASNAIVYLYRKIIKEKIILKRKGNVQMKPVTTVILIIILFSFADCGKQETPSVSLQIAALQGNIDAVRKHIKVGSDLNIKDDYGSTPLIVAVTFGRTEVAKALINAGADIKITNNDGATPLHIAAFFCRTEIVKALLEKGADKNVRNKYGSTPLQSVAAPFEMVKSIYENIEKALKPVGLRFDYERIKETRPKIAEMLR